MSGGAQKRLQEAIGALEDGTSFNLARINGKYKELDIAIIKATCQVERPATQRDMRAIFDAISPTTPQSDIAYCIHALARRLAMTNSWLVALKTLVVIHRALREEQPTIFRSEVINYYRTRRLVLNINHLNDNSSVNAFDYSAWVYSYAKFLDEKLECFRCLKYDVATETPRTKDLDDWELLHHVTFLTQHLSQALNCQLQGAAAHNFLIRSAFSMVALEVIKIHNALSAGITCLIDKSFEMTRWDAMKYLDMCTRAFHQLKRTSEFVEACKSLDVGIQESFHKIELFPALLKAVEDNVTGADLQKFTRVGHGSYNYDDNTEDLNR